MIIENRRKKPYSQKLFNELCFLYLLIINEHVNVFLLDKICKQSTRTYHRYAKDLHDCGLTPELTFHNKKKKLGSTYIYYEFKNISFDDEYKRQNYLLKYSRKNITNLENNKGRLFRLGRMLINNYDNYYIDDDTDTPTLNIYDYDNIKNNASLRNYQRDIKLVKDVIYKMVNY